MSYLKVRTNVRPCTFYICTADCTAHIIYITLEYTLQYIYNYLPRKILYLWCGEPIMNLRCNEDASKCKMEKKLHLY